MSKHHGLSKTRLYSIWRNMKARCYKEYDRKYKYYGGKGIKICDEWLNDFKCFYDWSMHNGYGDEFTIDRVDSSKNYCPENCRWVTMEENLVHQHEERDTKILRKEGNFMNLREIRKYKGLTVLGLSKKVVYLYAQSKILSVKERVKYLLQFYWRMHLKYHLMSYADQNEIK